MFSFANIVELNLGCNWFGVQGLYDIKDQLLQLTAIKTLGLGTSKLCVGAPDQLMETKMLGEILPLFTTLENLNLEENGFNDLKFECLIPALVSLLKLKNLNLAKNPLTHLSIESYFKQLQNPQNNCELQKLNLIGCNL